MSSAKVIRRLCNTFDHTNGFVLKNIYIGMFEMDVLRMTRDGFVYEYEVKTTLSDFYKDFDKVAKFGDIDAVGVRKHDVIKSGNYVANRFYYVLTEEIYNKVDIPDYAGAIVVRENGFVYKKTAPMLSFTKHYDLYPTLLFKMAYRENNLLEKLSIIEDRLSISNHNLRVVSAGVDVNSLEYYIHKDDPDTDEKYQEYKKPNPKEKKERKYAVRKEVSYLSGVYKVVVGSQTYDAIMGVMSLIEQCIKETEEAVANWGYKSYISPSDSYGGGVSGLYVDELPDDWRWEQKRGNYAFPKTSTDKSREFYRQIKELRKVTNSDFSKALKMSQFDTPSIMVGEGFVLIKNKDRNYYKRDEFPMDAINLPQSEFEALIKDKHFKIYND
jgi:hypothetical protein